MKFRILLIIALVELSCLPTQAQLNTERIVTIGRNALYFEDYVLSIQYFNQVIKVKPYLAEPYLYRAIAKYSLDDFKGAEEDCSAVIERNPFLVNTYQVRGLSRLRMGNYEGAVADYQTGLRYSPQERSFWLNKALAETKLKRYDDALESHNELIKLYPSFSDAYLTRAQFYLERKDTVTALVDIEKSISLDKNNASTYAMRAYISADYGKAYAGALKDMDKAITLEPNNIGFYLNRAVLKYHLNDLRGAMGDYNHVVEIEPANTMARYNRGLLRAQVGENNKAIEDFGAVIQSEPTNYFAYYNRATLLAETGSLREAIVDYDVVLRAYPDFSQGFYARSEAKRKLNDKRGGEADFNRAMTLSRKTATSPKDSVAVGKTRKESDTGIDKFAQLLVTDGQESTQGRYADELRGRVQDKTVKISLLPPFVLSYYTDVIGSIQRVYYHKSLQEFNTQRLLRHRLYLSPKEHTLTQEEINSRFTSIDDYSRLIEIDNTSPIALYGRALDFVAVQDFSAALDDLNRLILVTNNFAFAYFNRAIVRYKQLEVTLASSEERSNDASVQLGVKGKSTLSLSLRRNESLAMEYEMVMRDYDKVLEIFPDFVYAYYNRAGVRAIHRDYQAAIADYSEAIRLKPDLGEAYYNRGLLYLAQGDNQRGTADLSRAGELGIAAAYNILKRESSLSN